MMSVADVRPTSQLLPTSQAGMTWLQLLVLVSVTILFLSMSVPLWLEQRRVAQADVDVEVISEAIKKYHRHTNQYPEFLDDLVSDPGIDGWRYPYLNEIPKTPWRGTYVLIPKIYKVCMADDGRNVSEKYLVGGASEISRVYLEGRQAIRYWWQTGPID